MDLIWKIRLNMIVLFQKIAVRHIPAMDLPLEGRYVRAGLAFSFTLDEAFIPQLTRNVAALANPNHMAVSAE